MELKKKKIHKVEKMELKKKKQEGLMFWNIFLNILWKSLSLEISSALITVKVF